MKILVAVHYVTDAFRKLTASYVLTQYQQFVEDGIDMGRRGDLIN